LIQRGKVQSSCQFCEEDVCQVQSLEGRSSQRLYQLWRLSVHLQMEFLVRMVYSWRRTGIRGY